MAELKPVPGQILLTDREYAVLLGVVKRALPQLAESEGYLNHLRETIVRGIMESLNRSRLGEPAGEVHRSPNGSLAVRVQGDDDALGWDIPKLEPEDETTTGITPEIIRSWAIIHTASWHDRLTESDYVRANGKTS